MISALSSNCDVLAEYTALLQRLHDARRELRLEQQKRELAEDHAWATVLDELAGAGLHESIERLCRTQGITLVTATGKRVTEVSLGEFDILTTLPAERGEDDGLIVETVRPAMLRTERLVRAGQIVVLVAAPVEGSSHEPR